MSIDRIIMAFAGTMILLSLLLAQVFSPWWLLLTAFVASICCRRLSPAFARWQWR